MNCSFLRRHARALLLALVLLLGCLPAHGETAAPIHLYLGIPFDPGTVEMVTDILAKEKNATFEMNPNGGLCGDARNIEEYGYLFDIQVDFSDGQPQRAYSFATGKEFTRYPPAIERIRLNSLQNARITPEEGKERIPADLQQYLDMAAQLTAQYGQPDIQYFESSRMEDKHYIHYQFPDNRWDLDALLQVIDNDRRLTAHSVWGNVALEARVDLGVTYEGVSVSQIILYFYPTAAEGTVTLSTLDGAMIEMNGAHHVEIVGIELKAGRDKGIYVESSENIKIADCQISKFADSGVLLKNSKMHRLAVCLRMQVLMLFLLTQTPQQL